MLDGRVIKWGDVNIFYIGGVFGEKFFVEKSVGFDLGLIFLYDLGVGVFEFLDYEGGGGEGDDDGGGVVGEGEGGGCVG